MPAIGYVTKEKNGSFKGKLKTLTIEANVEIRHNPHKKADNHPDYIVTANGNVEIGAAWNKQGQASGKDYVSISFSAPEFGARRLYANLGQAAGQDDPDTLAIIWNPAD